MYGIVNMLAEVAPTNPTDNARAVVIEHYLSCNSPTHIHLELTLAVGILAGIIESYGSNATLLAHLCACIKNAGTDAFKEKAFCLEFIKSYREFIDAINTLSKKETSCPIYATCPMNKLTPILNAQTHASISSDAVQRI